MVDVQSEVEKNDVFKKSIDNLKTPSNLNVRNSNRIGMITKILTFFSLVVLYFVFQSYQIDIISFIGIFSGIITVILSWNLFSKILLVLNKNNLIDGLKKEPFKQFNKANFDKELKIIKEQLSCENLHYITENIYQLSMYTKVLGNLNEDVSGFYTNEIENGILEYKKEQKNLYYINKYNKELYNFLFLEEKDHLKEELNSLIENKEFAKVFKSYKNFNNLTSFIVINQLTNNTQDMNLLLKPLSLFHKLNKLDINISDFNNIITNYKEAKCDTYIGNSFLVLILKKVSILDLTTENTIELIDNIYFLTFEKEDQAQISLILVELIENLFKQDLTPDEIQKLSQYVLSSKNLDETLKNKILQKFYSVKSTKPIS